jgi:hypothetical protein
MQPAGHMLLRLALRSYDNTVICGPRRDCFHVNETLLYDAAGSPKRNATQRVSAAGQWNLLKICHVYRDIG